MVDVATRFSISSVIYSKDKKGIVNEIMEKWIGTGLGSSSKFLTDNGGEFANDNFKDMCEYLNITSVCTAAESPFSNGLCERNHAVIDEMVKKILADRPSCSLSTALAWAIHAKKSLQMVGGYGPYQLVFGRNPKIPSIIEDQPPALEGTTINFSFAEHLNALHIGRRAFLQAETSERIRRALRHNLRPCGTQLTTGDTVYYKRDGQEEWKGPGRVIGRDGKVIIIKHGSQCYRIHSSRVMKGNYEIDQVVYDKPSTSTVPMNTNSPKIHHNNCEPDDSDEDEQNGSDEAQHETDVHESKRSEGEQAKVSKITKTSRIIPKVGDKVRYIPKGDLEWREAEVLSRAGKSTGIHKNRLNIRGEGDEMSLDFVSGVDEW